METAIDTPGPKESLPPNHIPGVRAGVQGVLLQLASVLLRIQVRPTSISRAARSVSCGSNGVSLLLTNPLSQ